MGPRVSKRRRGNIKLDVPLTGAVTHTALIGGGEGQGRAERAGRGGAGGGEEQSGCGWWSKSSIGTLQVLCLCYRGPSICVDTDNSCDECVGHRLSWSFFLSP